MEIEKLKQECIDFINKNYDIIELKEATNLTFRKSKQQKVISILVKNY